MHVRRYVSLLATLSFCLYASWWIQVFMLFYLACMCWYMYICVCCGENGQTVRCYTDDMINAAQLSVKVWYEKSALCAWELVVVCFFPRSLLFHECINVLFLGDLPPLYNACFVSLFICRMTRNTHMRETTVDSFSANSSSGTYQNVWFQFKPSFRII